MMNKIFVFIAANAVLGALGPVVLRIAVKQIFQFNGPPPTWADWAVFGVLIGCYLCLCAAYNFIAFQGGSFAFRLLMFLLGAVCITAVFLLLGSSILK